MSEALHYINEPPLSAAFGWQQMQGLLDEHMPVKRQWWGNPLRNTLAVAVLLLVFLCTTLPLDKSVFRIAQSGTLTNVSIPSFPVADRVEGKDIRENLTSPKRRDAEKTNSEKWVVADTATVKAGSVAQKADEIQSAAIEENTADTTMAAVPNKAATPPANTAQKLTKETKPSRWHFTIAAAVNTNLGSRSLLNPYPFAEAKYDIGARYFVAAGIAPFSTSGAVLKSNEKKVIVDDIQNNVWFYNEINTYKQLKYLDIPVSVGTNINSRLSVQAGLQLSVLISKKYQQVINTYDFQNMRTDLPVAGFAALPVTDYSINVKRFDYRATTAIRYRIKQFAVGLTYQQGLQTIGKGAVGENHRNNMLSLGVYLNLK